MTPDSELLRRYVLRHDEAAFAEIVRRYVNLIYAAALRQVHGDSTLAEDVTQGAFAELARKAENLTTHPTVAGWLHVTARNFALESVRSEHRRHTREREAMAMNEITTPAAISEIAWEQLCPILDEAVSQLADADRDAVLLRFFQNKTHREVGDLLGLSENTARMRIERALDKLHAQFSRRGVTTTAALLASALGVHAAGVTAPGGLAASVVSKSLGGAQTLGAAPAILPKTAWAIWAGAGTLAAVLLFFIIHRAPANEFAKVSQNSSNSASTVKSTQDIRTGTLSAALPATASATTTQNSPPTSPSALAATSDSPTVPADSATVAALVSANNRFAIDLFRRVNPKPTENAFFSPYSISTALAMTWAGARGDTASQMAKALHFSELPDNTVLSSFTVLQQTVARAQTLGGAQLAIANSLWPEQNPEHPLLPNFLNLVQANFSSAITPVDFIAHPVDATKQINDWVNDKTNGKIKGLLQPPDIDSLTRLVLVNAIYFKGNWTNTFSPRMNANAEFHAADGSAIPAILMNNSQYAGYLDIKDAPVPCQLLSLSYSTNSRSGTNNPQHLSFVALLPRNAEDLSTLEKSLTAEQLAGWLERLPGAEVNVYLPKFILEERYSMANTLEAMGVKDAFHPAQADFSGMDGTRNLFISKVIHQTLVNLDENGTEAAAATAVIMAPGGIPESPTVEFRADHPFLFFIRDDISGSILFIGQLASPAPMTGANIPPTRGRLGRGTTPVRTGAGLRVSNSPRSMPAPASMLTQPSMTTPILGPEGNLPPAAPAGDTGVVSKVNVVNAPTNKIGAKTGLSLAPGPANGSELVRAMANQVRYAPAATPRGPRADLTTAAIRPLVAEYFLSPDNITTGKGLEAAEDSHDFLYVLESSGAVVAYAAVQTDASGTGKPVTNLSFGTMGIEVASALGRAAALPGVKAGSYEPRVLTLPAMGKGMHANQVLWLKSTEGNLDLIYMFDPTNGLQTDMFSATSGLQKDALISTDNFLKLIRPLVQQALTRPPLPPGAGG